MTSFVKMGSHGTVGNTVCTLLENLKHRFKKKKKKTIDSFCCVILSRITALQFIHGKITSASSPVLIITFCALKSFFASPMELGLTLLIC